MSVDFSSPVNREPNYQPLDAFNTTVGIRIMQVGLGGFVVLDNPPGPGYEHKIIGAYSNAEDLMAALGAAFLGPSGVNMG